MEYRKLTELAKLPNNPRTIKDASFKSLCKSIQDNPDYFEARPVILSDRTGELVIIAGNQRYEAAKHLKLSTIPTHLLTGLTDKREREIIIRDNVANGEWDLELLKDYDKVKLGEWGVVCEWPVDISYGSDGFTLPDGDKAPFQQMTFTLADEQAVVIQNAIADIKKTDDYKFAETMGNENSNGNALYLIVASWAGQRI